MNGYFNPTYSTNDIWRDDRMDLCLTLDLEAIEADIAELEANKANATHTHTEYASSSDLQVLEDVIDTKADANHTHTGYATSTHTHNEYATIMQFDILNQEINGKASSDHTHSDYSPVSHAHTEYASTSHSHNEYSATSHDHDEDYAPIEHSHNDYATTTALNEVSSALSGKANISHSHDDVYYTETEIDTLLTGKANSSHTHTGVYDASGAAASALASANAYTDSKIDALVGDGASTTLDTIGEISSAIEDNQDAIDLLNAAIANKANVIDLDSHTGNTTIHVTQTDKNNLNAAKAHADTAHAPANAEANQNAFSNIIVGNTTVSADTKTDSLTLIAGGNIQISADATNDSVTISATDTVYTLPSADSALGGVKTGGDVTITSGVITVNDDSHNHVISNVDGLQTALDGKASSGHNHDGVYYTETEVDELMTGKANISHNHSISNITNLQSTLDGKAATSHGTHVSYSTIAPVMDGSASVGTATTVARSDHKHPVDTSRASKEELDAHDANTTKHITSTERTNWGAGYTHSQSAHAPSNAEKNQNAFSYVKVGTTSVAADTATDTLTLVAGNNVTITPDATGDSITISSTDTNTTYSAGTGISLSGTTFSNSGVRAVATGGTNGTISVNTNGTSVNVAVKGLGSAAYTSSSAYDAAGTAQLKADTALASAQSYTDTKVANLINGAPTTLDTLKEIADAMAENEDVVSALNTAVGTKASTSALNSHTSNKSNPHNVTLAQLGITATAAELNKMDGVTATTAEINYVDGVTSNIQTQLNGKAASNHAHDTVYSPLNHNHNGVYATSNHTHTEFASTNHTHTASAVGAIATNDVATVSEIETYLGI